MKLTAKHFYLNHVVLCTLTSSRYLAIEHVKKKRKNLDLMLQIPRCVSYSNPNPIRCINRSHIWAFRSYLTSHHRLFVSLFVTKYKSKAATCSRVSLLNQILNLNVPFRLPFYLLTTGRH